MEYRLQLIAKDVLGELVSADGSRLRRVAAAICKFAIERAGLESHLVNEAMRYLVSGQAVPMRIRTDLEDLVDQLDETYFDLKEVAEATNKGDETWHPMFHKARAAAAVLFACEEDPLRAASESAFEANAAAHDDTEALKKVMLESLHGR